MKSNQPDFWPLLLHSYNEFFSCSFCSWSKFDRKTKFFILRSFFSSDYSFTENCYCSCPLKVQLPGGCTFTIKKFWSYFTHIFQLSNPTFFFFESQHDHYIEVFCNTAFWNQNLNQNSMSEDKIKQSAKYYSQERESANNLSHIFFPRWNEQDTNLSLWRIFSTIIFSSIVICICTCLTVITSAQLDSVILMSPFWQRISYEEHYCFWPRLYLIRTIIYTNFHFSILSLICNSTQPVSL